MSNDLDDIRGRLADLSAMAAQQQADNDRLADAAADRMRAVNEELGELRPRVNTDRMAADQYQRLIMERGQLQLTLAQFGR
jgi:hypothetical protein